jgi:predicted DNA binding CopG/RHH family protein
MSGKQKLKRFPAFKSDLAAERFVDKADLSQYDFSGFKPMRFELKAKTANVSMRMPQELLFALKAQAKREGIPYQRLMRQALENSLAVRQGQRR